VNCSQLVERCKFNFFSWCILVHHRTGFYENFLQIYHLNQDFHTIMSDILVTSCGKSVELGQAVQIYVANVDRRLLQWRPQALAQNVFNEEFPKLGCVKIRQKIKNVEHIHWTACTLSQAITAVIRICSDFASFYNRKSWLLRYLTIRSRKPVSVILAFRFYDVIINRLTYC